jgi:hypothetical protein
VTYGFSFLHLRIHLPALFPHSNLGFISFEPANSPAQEELMKSRSWKIMPALSALALGTMFAPYAHAGCGLYSPAAHPVSWQPQTTSPRLVLAALAIEDEAVTPHGPSMVGMWKEHWISEGSEGLKDGAEFDASYSQWHSDGTEVNVSGLRAPMTGDVCLGVWIRTGARTYQMNHFGVSYDATGLNLVGPARIQQWLTINPEGNSTTGKFTVDQWDESGNLLAHFQGNVTGTRVTMETGFQKVE